MKKTCRNYGDLSDCLYDTPDRKCISWTPDEDAKPMPSRAAILRLVQAAKADLKTDSPHAGHELVRAIEQVEKQMRGKK